MGTVVLEGTANERREQIVRALARVTRSDLAALFDVRETGGTYVYGEVTSVGEPGARARWDLVTGVRHTGPWDPTAPGRWANRFASGLEGDLEERMLADELPVWTRYYRPVGLRFQRRALVYDGDRFVAWLGLVRGNDGRDFDRPDDRALLQAFPSLATAARAEARIRDDTGLRRAASIVARPDGSVELVSLDLERWLDPARRAALASWTRRADLGDAPEVVLIDDVAAAWVRLVGDDGRSRILWCLSRARRPSLGPLGLLSRRQREIAEYASAGATVEEIAGHLELSAETVRTHLKAVYRALGIANRLELRDRLASTPSARE